MKLHVSACNGHRQVSKTMKKREFFSLPPHETSTKVTYTRGSPERDGSYDKLESVQPQEETLMSSRSLELNFFIGYI